MKQTIQLTESELKGMIMEAVESVLRESVSDIVYHFTSLKRLINILTRNEFYLTLSTDNVDSFDNKRLFYMSMQRTRTNKVGYASASPQHLNVRIQLDGHALNQRYKGHAVNFWRDNRKNDRARESVCGNDEFEYEDRLFSYDPVIKNADRYIQRVDVLADWSSKGNQNLITAALFIAQMKNIPLFVYNDKKEFNAQTDNTINNYISSNMSFVDKKTVDDIISDIYKYSQSDNDDSICAPLHYLMKLYLHRIGARDTESARSVLAKFNLERLADRICNSINPEDLDDDNEIINATKHLSQVSCASMKNLNQTLGNDDGNNTSRFAAYVLRIYGCSNFQDLEGKLSNELGKTQSSKTFRYDRRERAVRKRG